MTPKRMRAAVANNHKRQMIIEYASGKRVTLHYGQVGIKKKIRRVWIDSETRGKSVGIEYVDGATDYMPYDQPLAATNDPLFLLQNHIEILTATIRDEIKKQKISKKYLAQELSTSVNQVQRLLNPKIVNKNLEQLYRIAYLLNLHIEVRLRKTA